MPDLETLVVDSAGTQFAYLDSGAPEDSSDYVTIFAIHGIIFSAPIFQKVLDLAPKSGLRIVAINRRDYPGSSPLSTEQLNCATGSDEEKAGYLRDRGLEYLYFLDRFIQLKGLPLISEDGKQGGVALLGWSLGTSFSTAAIASAPSLEDEVKDRLAKYVRASILQDPPSVALGLPIPPGSWGPSLDASIPPKDIIPFTMQWLTGYFDHGDVSPRDPSALSHVVPSTQFVPTIYSMHSQISGIAFPAPVAGSDGLLMANLGSQLHANYAKACFSSQIRQLFPHMKVYLITGDMTGAFGVVACWQIQDDDAERGGGKVEFELVLSDLNRYSGIILKGRLKRIFKL
ncbi:hypothetical protein CC1G_11982 [Coprinopsis cinerea okayama7|uniref:Uncharacterized protein n=1 Tax=Coprinopsis cinerea (strain Okayama-7 / 130 / ATCC MYA-4618 / FGSC 9003) TaxID=240176 RepID=A8P0P4_COPC7|nr:hypothetical protein CC1G_11982 [Coprinopsis cinerea okayama7\|eukprot:XP_001837938.2 hypothetical protein CC1G_11982 [Coprinopsis cinerea okayama7\